MFKSWKIWSGALIALFGIGLAAALATNVMAAESYTVTFKVNNEEYGQIYFSQYSLDMSDPNSWVEIASGASVPAGATVWLLAGPENLDAYKFVKWIDSNGDTVSTDYNLYFELSGDVDYTAVLEPDTDNCRVVTLAANGNGQVTATKTVGGVTSPIYSGDSVEKGARIVVTLIPDQGYRYASGSFSNVGDREKIDDLCFAFTLGSLDASITVDFMALDPNYTYNITVSPMTGGSVTSDPSGTAMTNQIVRLTIAPAAGYQLGTISVKRANGDAVELSGSGANRTFSMPLSNVTVAATFVPEGGEVPADVTVTVTTDGNGTATVDNAGSSAKKPEGSDFALRATANSGYTFDSWVVVSGTGNFTKIGSLTNRSTSLTGVTGDVTVKATFKKSGGSGGGSSGGGSKGGSGSGGGSSSGGSGSGSSAGGSQSSAPPAAPGLAIDPAAAAMAAALGIPARNEWGGTALTGTTNTVARSVMVKPLTQTALLASFEKEAAALLAGSQTALVKDASGSDYVRVYAAFDAKVTAPAGGSAVVSFPAGSLTFGNKFFALVKRSDGKTSYAPVDVDFANSKLNVRLTAAAAQVVVIEYRQADTSAVGNLRLTAVQQRRIFDAAYYAEQNPDVVQAFGNNRAALYRHFISYGLREGRAGNEFFDIAYYRLAHPDLQKAFGSDTAGYVRHYLQNGRSERRVAGIRGGSMK